MIDEKLTTEIALATIGEILEISDKARERFRPDDGWISMNVPKDSFGFSCENGYWDMTWELNEDSRYMRDMKRVREVEAGCKLFTHELSIPLGNLDIARERMDYQRVPGMYGSQVGQPEMFSEREGHECLRVGELLSNAVEHGSNFGQLGTVRLRFVGGERGALFLVDDPGEGCLMRSLTDDEMDSIADQELRRFLDRFGDQYENERLAKREFRRAGLERKRGFRVLTRDEIRTFGSEKLEDGFRTMAIYPLNS